jgi:hypothetical protein
MKKLLLGFLIILSANVFAQQKGISYQAVIINPNSISAPGYNAVGTPLANKSVCMSFQILNAASQTEYQETQTISTDQYGMVNLVIGTGTKTGGTAASLAAVTWSLGGKSLVVAVNTEGTCSSYTEISRQVLNYVPYAMYADDANIKDGFITTAKLADGSVTDAKVAAGINKTKVGLGNVDNTSDATKQISTATQAALNLKEDVANKSIDVTLADVTNTKFPTEKAVKAYVDGKVAAATIADANSTTKGKIQLAGDLGGTAAAPTVPGLATKANISSLATVATSGNYNDLTNKPAAYALPTASASELGGVKVGTGLTITNGVLSASGSGVPFTGASQAVDLGAFDLKVNGMTVGRGLNGSIDSNVGIGKDVLKSVTGGSYLTAVGHEALYSNTTGYNNTAIGSAALKANTSGLANTAIGSNSLQSNTTANFNTAVGNHALRYNTIGGNNTANGSNALEFNTEGRENSAFGFSALKSNTTGKYNTATGFNALSKNTTGEQNTATGWNALMSNTTGGNNTAFGWAALYPNTTGANNTAVGEGALKNNSTGDDNSAFGEGTLANNSTGKYNSAFGRESFHYNSTGENNTGLGWRAGNANTTGSNNTAIGMQANFGANNLTNATAIGYQANASASNSIQLGNTSVTNVRTSGTITAGAVTYPKVDGTAGHVLTANANGIPTWQSVSNGLPTASASTLGGIKVGTGLSIDGNGVLSGASSYSLPTASASELGGVKVGAGLTITGGVLSASGSGVPYSGATQAVDLGAFDMKVNGITVGRGKENIVSNIAIGKDALLSNNTFGQNNTAIGNLSLSSNTNGSQNTAIGSGSLNSNTTGFQNTAVGILSLEKNVGVSYNTAVGSEALRNTVSGESNTATGASALKSNISGAYNSAFGRNALSKSTASFNNVAFGAEALADNLANGNAAYGAYALQINTTGYSNTAVGIGAMKFHTTGNDNVAVGVNAGLFQSNQTTGSNNTAIGAFAEYGAANLSNATVIGSGATVSASNTIQLGNSAVTNVKTSGTITAGAVTYPKVDGTAGQVLTSNANGIPTWSAPTGGSTAHYVGEAYGGGIVFFVWDNGAHGLIVALNEIGNKGPRDFTSTTGMIWGPVLTCGAFRSGYGGGEGNTNVMISKISNTGQQWFVYAQSVLNMYSAMAAQQYDSTYGDWYLPSAEELKLIKANQNSLTGSGYNNTHVYWSSTETNDSYAYGLALNGSTPWYQKTTLNWILPVRKF